MNEKTIKAVEEQLRLRNERLALREKEFRLSAKYWRGRGIALAVVTLFVICGMAVFFGGIGLWKLSGTILSMEKRNIEENIKSEAQNTPPKEDGDAMRPEATPLTVPVNGLAVISHPTNGGATIVTAENKTTPDRWPLVVTVMMYGLLVLAGLGVAAFTVKHIANYHNELE